MPKEVTRMKILWKLMPWMLAIAAFLVAKADVWPNP
jgi:hypothetical protein